MRTCFRGYFFSHPLPTYIRREPRQPVAAEAKRFWNDPADRPLPFFEQRVLLLADPEALRKKLATSLVVTVVGVERRWDLVFGI